MIIMIICLTWFPSRRFRRTLHIPQFGGNLQERGVFTWRVSDFEELSGGYSQEMMGLVLVWGYGFILLFLSSILESSLIIFSSLLLLFLSHILKSSLIIFSSFLSSLLLLFLSSILTISLIIFSFPFLSFFR